MADQKVPLFPLRPHSSSTPVYSHSSKRGMWAPYRLHQLPRQSLGVILMDVLLFPILWKMENATRSGGPTPGLSQLWSR